MSEVADLTTVDEVWGGCPKCLSHDGYLNLYREHWFKCDSHRVRWRVGSNLFSSWRHESESDWGRNGDRLAGYRIVEPIIFPDKARYEPEPERLTFSLLPAPF